MPTTRRKPNYSQGGLQHKGCCLEVRHLILRVVRLADSIWRPARCKRTHNLFRRGWALASLALALVYPMVASVLSNFGLNVALRLRPLQQTPLGVAGTPVEAINPFSVGPSRRKLPPHTHFLYIGMGTLQVGETQFPAEATLTHWSRQI